MAGRIADPPVTGERRLAMTYADYLDWYGEGRRGEWVDGEVIVFMLISPDSLTRDRRLKFAEYQEAGIPEYWLLDARLGKRQADFYQLGAEGLYRQVNPDANGRHHSAALPGFWLDPSWLWQEPLPDPDVLKAIIAPAVWRNTLAAAERAMRSPS